MLRSRPRRKPAESRAPRATRHGAAPREPWAALAWFAVAMLQQDEPAARRAVERVRRARAPRVCIEETALMLMPHAGYPVALEALRVLADAWPGRARRTREGSPQQWRARGEATCRQVYGGVFERLMKRLDALHPDMRAWVVEEGYGRVLARPGLSAASRELIAVAVLAAAGWERQLVSHLRGARHAGARPAELERAVRCGSDGATPRARRAAARAWSLAFDATAEARGGS